MEHLALFPFGRQVYDYNGRVEHNITMFYASGSPDEVIGFLSQVARNLGSLPVERLEDEKRVLRVEAEGYGGLYAQLLSYRYGAVGHGLPAFKELGLRWLESGDIQSWAADRFTRDNAAVWLTGPPDGLSLPLPQGQRRPATQPSTLPRLTLPSQAWHDDAAVALTFEGTRSSPLNAGFGIATERAHDELRLASGVTYSPTGAYDHLTEDSVHLMLAADCEAKDSQTVAERLVKIYDALAGGDTHETELDWDRAKLVRYLDDPQSVPGRLDADARDELLGAKGLSDAQLLAERDALTSESIASAMSAVAETALVSLPRGAPVIDRERFTTYEADPADPLTGARFPPRQDLKDLLIFNQLVVAGEGFTYRSRADAPPVTILFEECVAAIEGPLGSITVVSSTGTGLSLHPDKYDDGAQALDAVRRRIPDSVFVPPDALAQTVDTLAREKLARVRRVPVGDELGLLGGVLASDEQLVNLAEARRGKFRGLLAITDRRLLFLFRGEQDDFFEAPLESVAKVEVKGLRSKRLLVHTDTTTEFSMIWPWERLAELRGQLDPSGSS